MYTILRKLLFQSDPETIHHRILGLMSLLGALPLAPSLLGRFFEAPESPVTLFGVRFRNRVGLAAGYDKDGTAWHGLAALGFGHIETGTITLRPQQGNAKPRIFRYPEQQALVNRMGFPGLGAAACLAALNKTRSSGCILGVNIGKNKDTPNENAVEDYLALFRLFAPIADYIAVNVSSPNTIGLRQLQARQLLDQLLGSLAILRRELASSNGRSTPILVKLAPDLEQDQLADALDVIQAHAIDGVIATNTTLQRPGMPPGTQDGGLSGKPLGGISTGMIKQISRLTNGSLPIIGVGGIMDSRDALEKLDAGASLVQVYTGLIYCGPGLVREINQAIARSGMFA